MQSQKKTGAQKTTTQRQSTRQAVIKVKSPEELREKYEDYENLINKVN